MPGNQHALLLIVLFIVPGFHFSEVDSRRRPAQKRGTFDRTVLSVLFSTILHAILAWPILLILWFAGFDLAQLFDGQWVESWGRDHVLPAYACMFSYFAVSLVLATACGTLVGKVARNWTPVLSQVVQRNMANAVFVQMKNGDFFTGVLDKIPADYDVLQSANKDFTIIPPGRYKPKGRDWQNLYEEVVVLNTVNIDSIRIMRSPLTETKNDDD